MLVAAILGAGEALGAPDHPHRGFETVSYILQGSLQHKDSNGNEGNLSDGWVQWMTAGSGGAITRWLREGSGVLPDGGALEFPVLISQVLCACSILSPEP